MALTKLPSHSALVDKQWVQVSGPDELISGFAYDAQTRSLYGRESQISQPGFHGISHIAEDPIPTATCDTIGLMSSDDKCKLDALTQTRLGVVGFQGGGFSDDGGWMCFPPDAPVLLPDSRTGRIDTVKTDDLVVTHTGGVKRVIRTFKRHYVGNLINLRLYGHLKGRLLMTPEHPVLAVRNTAGYSPIGLAYAQYRDTVGLLTPKWLQAKDLRIGDYVARRLSSSVVSDRESLTVIGLADRVEIEGSLAYSVESWNKSLGRNKASQAATTFRNTAAPVNNEIAVGPEFLRLCGYYLAEGHIDGPPDRPKEVIFSLHAEEVFGDIGADIASCCESVFGIATRTEPDPSGGFGYRICITSAIVARFFKALLPGTAHTKFMPRWMMELPSSKQRQLLIAFLLGDGTRKDGQRNKVVECRLCNEQLINQFCAILERLNATPTFSSGSRLNKKTGKRHNYYMLSVQAADAPWLWEALGGALLPPDGLVPRRLDFSLRSNGYTLQRISEISTMAYDGLVHNIEVEDDNSYVINGSVVHNCGDVILAAGSEFISIERFGNVLRWTVDAPIPLNCGIEACAQIFWVQDETEVSAIRPPSCAGKLPGVDMYGEMKIYLMPESTLIDPTIPATVLNTKGKYPSLIFKRYDDSVAPGVGEFELILKRTISNQTEAEVGWVMTPGAGATPECVWFMGSDDNGDRIRFELDPVQTPGILGGILFNGHLLTKRSGVVTDYTTQILSTNQYVCKWWDIHGAIVAGDETFVATNVWQYDYPEGGINNKQLVLDKTIDILPVGTIVDVWFFQVGEVNGHPIRQYVFNCRPKLNAANMWSEVGGVEFGTQLTARSEPTSITESFGYEIVSDVRNFEHNLWGLTGIDVPYLLMPSIGTATGDTVGAEMIVVDVNDQYLAQIDTSIPALVVEAPQVTGNYRQRPVCLWSRHNASSCLATIALGRPSDTGTYPPYDILLNAPIDSHEEYFLNVVEAGILAHDTGYYVLLRGAGFHELPSFGSLRLLTGTAAGATWNFSYKSMYSVHAEEVVALVGTTAFPGSAADIVQVLHQEYSAPCVRLDFALTAENKVQLTFKVGTLDVASEYEAETISAIDDYVRGMEAGYAVSGTYIQDDVFTGDGTQPAVNVDGFVVYNGGMVVGSEGSVEYWNELEIMQRGDQVWIWWNGLLIPPSSTASAILPTPVTISTPYFPITRVSPMGKFGMRMFPGCKLRRIVIRDYNRAYSEYTRGQIELA